MQRYIAFLRAINVGGHVVKMEALRSLFEAMKFRAVETFIASGNVIFETNSCDVDDLQSRIELRLHKALGYEVAAFLRTDSEVSAIARYKPFAEAAVQSATTFCVGFLANRLTPEAELRAMSLRSALDDFHIRGCDFYWLGQKKQSESAFSHAVLEKALGIRATFRGMNTVQKLAAKYPPTGLVVTPTPNS
jgi:uncharacterized protein (DUF1697 family)